MLGNVFSKVRSGGGRVLLKKGAKWWLEVRAGKKWTAFAFAKLLDPQRFGKEADKRRAKALGCFSMANAIGGLNAERRK
jgi:hypothetical protein